MQNLNSERQADRQSNIEILRIIWGCGHNSGHIDTKNNYGIKIYEGAGSCCTHTVQ